MKTYGFLLLASMLFLSCNDDFSANGDYTPQLIVYSVLEASTDTQYVRVYSSFSPDVYRPDTPSPKSDISGAMVKVYDDSSEYIFSDTMITVTSANGSADLVRMYVSRNFRPKEKKLYNLSVKWGGYPEARSTTTGLEASQIILFQSNVLFEPLPGKNITFDLYFGKNVSAYLATLTIQYEVQVNSVWKPFFREIPISVVQDASGKITKKFFPVPQFIESQRTLEKHLKVHYPTEIYTAVINEIKEENKAAVDNKQLKFKDVKLQLMQFDNEIFTYYSIANNFPGATTIRLDEPDYTNIDNGFGIFGSTTFQLKTYGIPSEFP